MSSSKLLKEFDFFCKSQSEISETFCYWENFLKMVQKLTNLPETAIYVYRAFSSGNFSVKRIPGEFNSVGVDMCLELQREGRGYRSNQEERFCLDVEFDIPRNACRQ